jgi:hypothetical protein
VGQISPIKERTAGSGQVSGIPHGIANTSAQTLSHEMEHKVGYFVVLFSLETVLKITVFWDVTPCSLAELNKVSEVYVAFIFGVELKATDSFNTWQRSTGLHGVMFQKTLIFTVSNI